MYFFNSVFDLFACSILVEVFEYAVPLIVLVEYESLLCVFAVSKEFNGYAFRSLAVLVISVFPNLIYLNNYLLRCVAIRKCGDRCICRILL